MARGTAIWCRGKGSLPHFRDSRPTVSQDGGPGVGLEAFGVGFARKNVSGGWPRWQVGPVRGEQEHVGPPLSLNLTLAPQVPGRDFFQ